MKFFLLFIFLLSGMIKAEDDLKHHLIYSEKTLHYKDEFFSCDLKLTDELLMRGGGGIGGGESTNSIARRRYKIINSLDDRLEYLTGAIFRVQHYYSNLSADKKNEKNDQAKCLYAILLRDYAETKNIRYKLFSKARESSSELATSMNLESKKQLLQSVIEGNFFSLPQVKKMLLKNIQNEFKGIQTVEYVASIINIKIQDFLFLNFDEFKKEIDVMKPEQLISLLINVTKEGALSRSKLTSYIISKISFENLSRFEKTQELVRLVDLIVESISNDHEWDIFKNCLSDKEKNELTSSCFHESVISKAFNSSTINESHKCELAKKIILNYNPQALSDDDLSKIDGLRSVRLACVRQELEKKKLFGTSDARFFKAWCVDSFKKENCSKYFDNDWIIKAQSCNVDTDCSNSLAENKNRTFLSGKNVDPEELKIFLENNFSPSLEYYARNVYLLKEKPVCVIHKCNFFKFCTPKENYKTLYNDYISQDFNKCTSKEECKVSNDSGIFFPINKTKNSLSIGPGPNYISLIFMQSLDGCYEQNSLREKVELDNLLKNKKADCLNGYCQFENGLGF